MADANTSFKKGDVIIRLGQAYRVFKTKYKTNSEGKKQKFIFYKPYFQTNRNRGLIRSIPEKSLRESAARRPLSKTKLKHLLKQLTEKIQPSKPINLARAKEIHSNNNPQEVVQILRRLWFEKNSETINFTKSKKDVFTKALRRLAQELAYIKNQPLPQAKQEILDSLKKGTHKSS